MDGEPPVGSALGSQRPSELGPAWLRVAVAGAGLALEPRFPGVRSAGLLCSPESSPHPPSLAGTGRRPPAGALPLGGPSPRVSTPRRLCHRTHTQMDCRISCHPSHSRLQDLGSLKGPWRPASSSSRSCSRSVLSGGARGVFPGPRARSPQPPLLTSAPSLLPPHPRPAHFTGPLLEPPGSRTALPPSML